MATPQYGTAIFALGSPLGPKKNLRFYASDAAGAVTWPDGSSELNLSSQNVYLIDWYQPAAMATMVSFTHYVAGSPKVVTGVNDINTTQNRQFLMAPLLIPGGASYRVVQA